MHTYCRMTINLPTPIVSKYVQSSDIGKVASSVHITTSHRHSHIMAVYIDRPCCISCYGTNIDNNINTVENKGCSLVNIIFLG